MPPQSIQNEVNRALKEKQAHFLENVSIHWSVYFVFRIDSRPFGSLNCHQPFVECPKQDWHTQVILKKVRP
jgi:hypothetical protein